MDGKIIAKFVNPENRSWLYLKNINTGMRKFNKF